MTTQEVQEQAVLDAWIQFGSLGVENRRVLAALHYFHVAMKLLRAGHTPGEFLAEVILNLSKTLEVLFPPLGGGKTRDAVRAGLRTLGYEDREIENAFVPVMALRDAIDVAHVGLALFTLPQLTTIHTYGDSVELSFRELLKRVLKAIETGTWAPPPYEDPTPSSEAKTVLARLESMLSQTQG